MGSEKVHVLEAFVMNYAWGRPGNVSTVAKLAGKEVEPNKPYAELWMGTHPNGPSKLVTKSISLKEYLEKNPSALAKHEFGDLQFLFKVLSVGKALSVQSHPTKELARVLHARDPKNYPDDNHKPEMTVALTNFEVLCGFRPASEIVENFKNFPETEKLIPKNLIEELEKRSVKVEQQLALKEIFSALMHSNESDIGQVIKEIISKLEKKTNRTELENLILRLNQQFPDSDVGVLSPLLLRFLKLKPGDSVFLGPNEPHAYLDGDCIECMACSDNTIRAGLTPKFKDVPTLVSTLTYNMEGPTVLEPKNITAGVSEYKPPVPEFCVQKIDATAKALTDTKSSGIAIVVNGTAKVGTIDVKPGTVLFTEVDAGEVQLSNVSNDFLAFRAFTPLPEGPI